MRCWRAIFGFGFCLGGAVHMMAAKIPVVTVCEVLSDLPRFAAKQVIVVGRYSRTTEGVWLDQGCGLKVMNGGREFPAIVAATYADSEFSLPPSLPHGFKWDEPLLQQKLNQVKQTTQLRMDKKDRWVARYGRLETRLPHRLRLSDGTYEYTPGFGHLAGSPAQLISPHDGSRELSGE
jgi:hypothetical protein